MKKFFWFLFIGLLASGVQAQISLTSTDLLGQIGKSFISASYMSYDIAGIRAILISPGENQSWSVIGRSFTQVDSAFSRYFAYPGDAPLANDPTFQGSNLVVESYSSYTPDAVSWSFYKASTEALLMMGYINRDNAGNYLKYGYSPPYYTYKFPLTYLTSWDASLNLVYAGASIVSSQITNRVTGYGNMTTPAGTFPCIRWEQKIVTFVPYNNVWVRSYNYYFLSKESGAFFNSSVFVMADSNLTPTVVAYGIGYQTAAVENSPAPAPQGYALDQNYPNPFNAATVFEFTLPRSEMVTLKVFDLNGAELATIYQGQLAAGRQRLPWRADNLASGVYFYQIQTRDFQASKKLILIR
ncbi:T9SS type A sorting domain-containing protein [candidate division KSB1 bacterium]|nr:T9SS type A sorting domain-containing protein [candidate division KSB1 bacterium]